VASIRSRAAKARPTKTSASPAAGDADRVRVCIVGGGCAGLSAAWQLSKLNLARDKLPPGQQTGRPRYEITVVESTWRLGGKGASVRDAEGRILEHGLHVWFGFYENAFRMMRECYAEVKAKNWGPDAAVGKRLTHGSFDEAFAPEPHIGVAGRRGENWEAWTAFLPPMKGEPGEALDTDTNPFTLWAYLARAMALAKALMQSVLAPGERAGADEPGGSGRRSTVDEALELDFSFDPRESPAVLIDRLATLARAVLLTSAAGVLQAATFVESWLRERNPAPQIASSLLKLVEAVATNTRRQLQDVVLIDETMRRKTEILDLLMTIFIGLLRDRVFFSKQGLDAIDGIDYRDWLEKHGATRSAVNSPLITGIYDLMFAYRDGEHTRPALSAAQALRGAMRMFLSYRGSMFWRMQSGMGDAVFAPLYRVLLARGVRFRFQRRLAKVDFDFEARRVTALRFERGGGRGVRGLDDLGAWPQQPLPGTSRRAWTWRDGDKFDAVVLATGLDDFVKVCEPGGLFDKESTFETMRKKVKTVATRSAQVWMDRSLAELGWERGPVVLAGIDGLPRNTPGAASRPYETWADMTHVLAAERDYRRRAPGGGSKGTPAVDPVRSVAYFCGVRPDTAAAGPLSDADREVKDFLDRSLQFVWPKAATDKTSASSHMLPSEGPVTKRSPATAYVSDNRDGSDRYTQSLPGSGTCRISPLDPWFANMTVAGDWCDCGFNGGCVEAAVISGMLAARAISGEIELHRIVGYEHP
jgi:uncharacterized protein with NAD-binding domain and iron-sulfur cluster